MQSFPQYFNQKKQTLTSFCAPFYSEIIFSKDSTGKWNGMEKNRSGMDISPSDPSFDIHGGFQNKFKTWICARVKKEVNISTFIPLRKHYTHFLIYSTTELEDNRGKLYSNYLNNGKAKGRLRLHSFLCAFSWLAEEVWNHLKSYCHSSISNLKPDSQVWTVLLRLMNIFPCEKGENTDVKQKDEEIEEYLRAKGLQSFSDYFRKSRNDCKTICLEYYTS